MLERLIDHAALFPPASMSLPEALDEDAQARESTYESLIGRFVVPAEKVADLPAERPALSVVLSGLDDVRLLEGAEGVEAVELVLAGPRPLSSDLVAAYSALRPLDVETYFELVFDERWRDSVPAAIGAVAAIGGRVKLRCGGTFFPSIEQVGLVVACCRDAGVPFKATAGLHHPVRRGDEHGFLNLLAAATAPRDRIGEVLGEEDGAALEVEEDGRQTFVSFGSCSWREPVDGLRELGMLQ
ncbi:MAG TPA: hypothetical protein VK486_16325 [Thermoleophilaceae bacterium]|nr:hypothetical protein [Thermoleophilaceae bacterium]